MGLYIVVRIKFLRFCGFLGDVEELGLTFEADENTFGKIESHELKYVKSCMWDNERFHYTDVYS